MCCLGALTELFYAWHNLGQSKDLGLLAVYQGCSGGRDSGAGAL